MMLGKLNKINYTLVKSYRIISLVDCLGKVCEKVTADKLADQCKVHNLIQKGQMRS